MDHAGAALRSVATDMGTGQPQILAQELHEQRSGVDIAGHGITVHDQGYFRHLRALSICADAARRHSHFMCFNVIIWAVAAMSNLTAAWLN
jgi:hypothetical protein